MKIANRSDFRVTSVVDLSKKDMPLQVTITTLPLSFSKKMQELFPTPEPPLKPVHGKDGKLVKLPDGSPEKRQDLEDREYKAALERNSLLQAVFMFWLATSGDSSVEWDHKVELKKATQDDFEKIWHEAEEAGLTMGDLAKVMEAATKLSNLDVKSLSDAED